MANTNWVFWETRKPLVVGEGGTVQQLQPDDGLNVGGYDLPNALSSNGMMLLTVNSEAVWAYASHTDMTGVAADQHHNEAHTVASHNDTTATGAELETLTDGSDATALHVHDGSDHDIADHNDTTATGAELETLTDGSDASALHVHDGADHGIADHNDTTATGAELETLTDGSDASALHVHDGADHDIADHNDTTATGAELETLTDGSDADALHTHSGSNHTIASHNDTTATGAELETLTDGSNADALHEHTYAATPSGNTTYYLATTGNDSTGNGTVGNPWETIDKALTVLYDTEFEHHAVATVVLAEGTYDYRDTLVPEIATNLVITGSTPLEYTISDINAVTANAPLYDAQITVNTTVGMSAGQYLAILSPTNKKYLNGGWEIISNDDGTHVTIRVYSHSTVVTTGNVVATVKLPEVMIETQDEYGFRVRGGGVQFKNLTFYPQDANSDVAIEARCVDLQIGPDVIVNGYDLQAVQLYNADVILEDVYASRCATGVYARSVSYVQVEGGAYGGNTIGMRGRASHIEADGCSVNGNSSSGISAFELAIMRCFNCDFYSNLVAAHISGESKGRVDGTNTFANNGTDRSPASTTEGNLNSYME